MKLWTLFVAILTAAGSLSADEPAGAKELFGGGLDREVVAPGKAHVSESVKPSKPTPKRLDSPFGLSCWIELVTAPGQKGAQVVHTRTFTSGEKIRLHFKSNANGFIYLIQLGASGTSSVLFPDPDRGLDDNGLHSGQDHVLPSGKDWFRFDSTPGTERLLVLFARKREDLEPFVQGRSMTAEATATLLRNAEKVTGSKDLVTEIVEDDAVYAVNMVSQLVVMQLALVHR